MADILNDEKHIILTKKEYDKLEELARGVVDSYEKKINKLQEMVKNLEEGKPFITHDFDYLHCSSTTLTYLDNTEDSRVVHLFKEQNERELRSQEEKFNKEIKEMSIFEFIRKRRGYRGSVFEKLRRKWGV